MTWTTGYSLAELEEAQERYGLCFPPDLLALFRERRPTEGYEWSTEDHRIREMLAWPFDSLRFDVEQGFWWPDWGARPSGAEERAEVLRSALSRAPRLIPLIGHRFLPETPHEEGNPVFSIYGFDSIYYGANLAEYFKNEFEGRFLIGPVRYIPFWSNIVEQFEVAYSIYAAANEGRQTEI